MREGESECPQVNGCRQKHAPSSELATIVSSDSSSSPNGFPPDTSAVEAEHAARDSKAGMSRVRMQRLSRCVEVGFGVGTPTSFTRRQIGASLLHSSEARA
jgi:hypothetical protein